MKKSLCIWFSAVFAILVSSPPNCSGETNSIFELRAKADGGDANAQYELAMKFERGEDVNSDDGQALQWLRKAAERTNAAAMYHLGSRYERGQGVEPDQEVAWIWYRKAAQQNFDEAQFTLGMSYYLKGGASNDTEALNWFLKAAAQTNLAALSLIGEMYSFGRGVEKSCAEAAKWHLKAAEGHYAMAKAAVKTAAGMRYYAQDFNTNAARTVNSSTAAAWSRKLGDESYALANFCLSQQFRYAQGIATNYVEAYAHLYIAAKTWDQYAKNRDALRTELSSGQLDLATKRIRELQAQLDAKRDP